MTDAEAKAFYNSNAWRNKKNGKRIEILKRDRFECQDCIERLKNARKNKIELTGEDRLIRSAKHVHHIKELKDNPEFALADNNLISLCKKCHDIRHERYIKQCEKKNKINDERW